MEIRYIRGHIYSLLLSHARFCATVLEDIVSISCNEISNKFDEFEAHTLLRISDEFNGNLTILTPLRNEDRKVGQNT